MQLLRGLGKRWPALLAALLALAALGLLWRVRDAPLLLGALGRVDPLSAFFLLALCGGAALDLAFWPAQSGQRWRLLAAGALLALAWSAALTSVIALAYLLFALLTLPPSLPPRVATQSGPAARVGGLLRWAARMAPDLLAAACLLLGYGALALNGASRYDDAASGAALGSFVFWFVLLAAAVACAPQGAAPGGVGDSSASPSALLRFAWLYPLARLYSLGPWNSGWSFAALLLGGALALWHAAALEPARSERGRMAYLALALAGLGLSSSAGVAAACYAMLSYLVLVIGRLATSDQPLAISTETRSSHHPLPTAWLLSSALPLSAPFVAAWMLVGAASAGGVALLAGAAWLVALLHALATVTRREAASLEAQRAGAAAAVASLALGVGAPLVVRWLIQPVAAQLQGGLTPYGDVNIWPWVGLAASDSAHTQVTTLPSIAIALLMLVLSALVYVLARLRALRGAGQDDTPGAGAPAPPLLESLRDEVPWLGLFWGQRSREQEQRRDGD